MQGLSVLEQIESGRYGSASEVVRASSRLRGVELVVEPFAEMVEPIWRKKGHHGAGAGKATASVAECGRLHAEFLEQCIRTVDPTGGIAQNIERIADADRRGDAQYFADFISDAHDNDLFPFCAELPLSLRVASDIVISPASTEGFAPDRHLTPMYGIAGCQL